MKKHLFLMMVATATLCVSCDNSMDDVFDTSKTTKEESSASEKQENSFDYGVPGAKFTMLEFATETDFRLAIEEPETVLSNAPSDFKSLSDEYDDAWKIEEAYYETNEKYNELKRMFPHLYFPEYEDDYSFFLPISDESIAKLVNPEGNVLIGGQVKNYIDIKTPERLLELGKLCPNPTNPSLTRAMDHTTVFLNSIPTQINDSNDRKMYASVSMGSVGGRNCLFVTITFRKKGPLNWKKYNSDGMLMGIVNFAQGPGYLFPAVSRKSGNGDVTFDALSGMGVTAPWPATSDRLTIGCSGLPGEFYMRVDTSKL